MIADISIIVPCYNQAEFLDDALESVLKQRYSNWECIIVNDGSPDNTEAVAKKWLEIDKRFKYLFQNNQGVSSARNLGIKNSNGNFILPLDADDKISPEYIDLALKTIKLDDSIKLVYCKAEKFGDEEGLWDLEPYSLYNLARFNMIFCSAVFRKQDWELVGGFDTKMINGIEDWEFWISILKTGGEVRCLDIMGFYYRIKKVSRHQQFNLDHEKYYMEYMSIKHADFFVSQYGSFSYLISNLEKVKKEKEELSRRAKSKRFVINLFSSTFFNFKIFGNE